MTLSEWNLINSTIEQELDKVDWILLLKRCWRNKTIEIYDVFEEIVNYEELPSFVSNLMCDNWEADNLIDYLRKRYKVLFYEETKYKMYKPHFI